ncbi:MAG: tRNA (adenine-N1)-methyltransferase [Candidatus Lokiarchaeota archaeon]|nr:tRNA (adenine-N1)-methyltransferase [Candidatus Lokiarchaeota archaeon]
MQQIRNIIHDQDLVYIVYDTKKRKWLRKVSSGEQFHTDRGYLDYDDIIGREFGSIVLSKPYGHKFFVFKPLPSDIIINMTRASQIIYPEDIGLILIYTGINSGSIVVEAGTGSGSLTGILGKYVQPHGHIYSYDIRDSAIKQARKNMKKLGVSESVTITKADILTEVDHEDVDVVVLDLATPWLMMEKVHSFLKNSGVVCSFSPVIEQVIKTHEALKNNHFHDINTYELLKREIRVKANATRPNSRMIGHTGYMTFARKLNPYIPENEQKKSENKGEILPFPADF